jgi:hypothetical protein
LYVSLEFSVLSIISYVEYVAQEKNLIHIGDVLVAELGKEAYKKYPFLYIYGNNTGANGANIRPGDYADSRTSTISEVANSTGMNFTVFIKDWFIPSRKLYFCRCSQFCDMFWSLNSCHHVSIHINV